AGPRGDRPARPSHHRDAAPGWSPAVRGQGPGVPQPAGPVVGLTPGAAGAPRVAAVVVSWNSLALLPVCLASLRDQTVALAEVVVVDNGSADGSVDWLRAQEDVTLVANGENRGFAVANNQGIAAT